MLIEGSFFEIYNEKVRDLLNPNPGNMELGEDKNKGVYVKNLIKIPIASEKDLNDIIEMGSKRRVMASTQKNKFSSRSHAIIQIEITQGEMLNDGTLKKSRKDKRSKKSRSKSSQGKMKLIKSKLMLVDLAGSEKMTKFDHYEADPKGKPTKFFNIF